MTTLSTYYTTNYTFCVLNQSIIAFPEFLSISAKLEALVIIPINLFGIYCILWKTPKYMQGFQWHLLHLHVWFLFLSISYTLLTTPYHFYPAVVRCSVGFLASHLDSSYQLIIIHLVYGGIVSSVILLFENRHAQLVPESDIFYRIGTTHRIFLGILNFLFGSSNILGILGDSEDDQEALKLKFLEVLPCPNALYFDPCSYAIGVPDTSLPSVISQICAFLSLCQFIFFITHSLIYLRKSQSIDTFSVRTKKLQKAFFKAAIAQVAAPVGVLVAPVLVLTYVMATKIYLQGLINIAILLIPVLSIFSTVSLLIFNVPYRKFVMQMLRMKGVKDTRIAVVSSL